MAERNYTETGIVPTDDIVTRLRQSVRMCNHGFPNGAGPYGPDPTTCASCQRTTEAADEIERLRAMILEYVAAETASWPPDDMESYARWEQRAGDAWDVLVAESNRFAT